MHLEGAKPLLNCVGSRGEWSRSHSIDHNNDYDYESHQASKEIPGFSLPPLLLTLLPRLHAPTLFIQVPS